MDQESVVYGCIKDIAVDPLSQEGMRRQETNHQAMMTLPVLQDMPMIAREMFSLSRGGSDASGATEVVHFGASYRAIEYEWERWLAEFEQLLQQMYWVSATVHLETELSGTHTFTWESQRMCHEPFSGDMAVRCEWEQEGLLC
ncbi:hypothetical protein EDC56_1415 [Sinobacterium caligoides]|uniref:Uncharacterized protein n=1 Tax=Sinobacterium caligoides TaxID=933926 RepID=A0A3N2DMT5_9GAMM|nr:hypothetical protein [Sinobacterium caligoides]ROS00992.1 hypothetical protein EDC56_1415 [Sinobacterium caligoides]